MLPTECNQLVLTPALQLLPVRMDSPAARRMLLAIGLQESELRYRKQFGGPARGIWMFEAQGGVAGVLAHPASALYARTICEARGVKSEIAWVHSALEVDDILAAAFARLLLWTDAKALPSDETEGWDYYLRTWRPGRPSLAHWGQSWADASEALELMP